MDAARRRSCRRYRLHAERLVARANEDLANNIGNSEAAPAIDWTLADFDFRRAAEAVLRIGDEGNWYVEAVRPWALARAERHDQASGGALDAARAELVETCRDLAVHLQPLLPAFAAHIAEQCGNGGTTVADPSPVFPRLNVGHSL